MEIEHVPVKASEGKSMRTLPFHNYLFLLTKPRLLAQIIKCSNLFLKMTVRWSFRNVTPAENSRPSKVEWSFGNMLTILLTFPKKSNWPVYVKFLWNPWSIILLANKGGLRLPEQARRNQRRRQNRASSPLNVRLRRKNFNWPNFRKMSNCSNNGTNWFLLLTKAEYSVTDWSRQQWVQNRLKSNLRCMFGRQLQLFWQLASHFHGSC